MTPDLASLGRRAVACKHWRWMPGILPRGCARITEWTPAVTDGALLDFSDPATVGCLLALVREAWNDEWLACKGEYSPDGPTWLVYSGKPHGRRFAKQVAGTRYPTEAAALVAALEAAP